LFSRMMEVFFHMHITFYKDIVKWHIVYTARGGEVKCINFSHSNPGGKLSSYRGS
jgi:hypothetical protein